MERPKLEVADVFRRSGPAYRQKHAASLSQAQRRVMSDIELCPTAARGGHLEECDSCGHQRPAYNSCAHRHCPQCQSLARAQWLEERQAELLQTQYFHLVFTVPQEIAALAYPNKETVYSILFRATAETLRTIAAHPQHLGAEIGFLAVLHSWGSNLLFPPHLHCVVPGGGIAPDGQHGVACRPAFFLPLRVLSQLFRRLFLKHLQTAFEANCSSSLRSSDSVTPELLPRTWSRGAPSIGWSRPNHPSAVRPRSSITSAGTPIAWPSPITAGSASRMVRSPSTGKIIGTTTSKKP